MDTHQETKGKVAIYAGSFDPLTVGHMWMIEQGARLFDRLIVAVGVNPEKKSFFAVEDRVEMIRRAAAQLSNISVDSFAYEYLIRYAERTGCSFILRGVRTESDYEYERVMRNINGDLNASITTVFLMPPREIAEVSSSVVKGLVGPQGWEEIVKKYVPAPVFEKLREVAYSRMRTK